MNFPFNPYPLAGSNYYHSFARDEDFRSDVIIPAWVNKLQIYSVNEWHQRRFNDVDPKFEKISGTGLAYSRKFNVIYFYVSPSVDYSTGVALTHSEHGRAHPMASRASIAENCPPPEWVWAVLRKWRNGDVSYTAGFPKLDDDRVICKTANARLKAFAKLDEEEWEAV